MANQNIAVVGNEREFNHFMSNIAEDSHTQYSNIYEINQVRGQIFTGYIVLKLADYLEDYERIIHAIKARAV